MAAKTPLSPEIDALRPHVDTAFSLATYPDIAAGRLDPVLHYHNHGWRKLHDPLVTVSLDGATRGICPTAAVTAAVAGARPHLQQALAVIHHLKGHSPERIANLVIAATGGPRHFWTQDFFTPSPS
jgi:hypothetical protein